ncbi:MAG: hypothetical protein RMJ84_11010, partial [Sandaracinaceae bacterium]|nr:hypothetical protein [Sandaracinaceae bacterium]
MLLLGLFFVLASLWGCGGGSGPVDAAPSLDTRPRPDGEGIDANSKPDAWVGSEASFHEAAFGDGSEGGVFVTDATQDASPADSFIARDGSGECAFTSLEWLRVDNFELHEAAPLHAGRSFRIAAHTILPSGCHLRAMPLVEIDSSS